MSTSPASSVAPRQRSVSISSSPTAAMSTHQLTPRSKVRAMLATVDDDSSEEDQAVNQQKSPSRPRPGPGSPSKYVPSAAQPASEDSDDDMQDAVVRPKGRMASKMQAGSPRAASQDNSGDDANGVSAYERIKRQLLGKQRAEEEADSPAKDSSTARESQSDADEEPSTFKAPRRRLVKRRAGGTATPKSAMRSSPPSSPGLSISPGPRVARQQSSSLNADESDSDLPEDLHSDPRFLASVAQEQQERLVKAAEAAEARKRQAQKEKQTRHRASSHKSRNSDDDSDSAADNRLTQQMRPSRKASKKAQEEMRRETQRMARNMHLQHEARTKKKVTKESLFERFNYRPTGLPTPPVSAPHPPTSSTVVSDTEGHNSAAVSSPPTSCVPSQPADDPSKLMTDNIINPAEGATVEGQTTESGDHGATYTNTSSGGDKPSTTKASKKPKRVLNLARLKQSIQLKRQGDSDSEVEIVPVSKAKAILSEHMPMDKEEEARSLLVLRACAHLNPSDDRPSKVKGSMTLAEMEAALKRRARDQGAKERLEHLEELRKRGIVPQTAEERAREEADIETLVEKARLEAEQLSKMEKEAAKKEDGSAEDALDLLDDSTEDEEAGFYDEQDYEGEAELSGSDEEGDVEELVDDEAAEDEGGEEDSSAQGDAMDTAQDADGHDEKMDEGEDDEDVPEPMPHRRRRRANLVISDDEDDVMETEPAVQVPQSAKKAPTLLFPVMGAPMMPLSEIFAGTMVDTPATPAEQPNSNVSNRGPICLDFLRHFPALTPPTPGSHSEQPSQDMVRDSQPVKDNNEEVIHGPQMVPSPTQISEFPDPTQDIGFSTASPTWEGTIDTLLVEKSQKSPRKSISPVKKQGRLQRRTRAVEVVSDGDDEGISTDNNTAPKKTTTAFDTLFEAANQPVDPPSFNKKKSRAKEMVDEVAEESEDEYAGLGGASEDGHSEDSDGDMSDLVNDEDVADVREEDLVALMADKDRADDKRRIEQIYNDVTTGALRRKRGAGNNTGDYDLSDDSDYHREVRRQMKRIEEAKLRRALLADENIEKIATNPKKSAFFRSIEDRDERRSDDDDDDDDEEEGGLTFIDEPTYSQNRNSQYQPPTQDGVMITKTTSNGSLKRTFSGEDSMTMSTTNDENQPPSHLRRQAREKRPRTVSDIRETLSAMIAPPNAIVPVATYLTDDETSQDGSADILNQDDEDHGAYDSGDDNNDDMRGGKRRVIEPTVMNTNQKKKRKLGEGVSNPFEIARRTLLSRSTTDISTGTDDSISGVSEFTRANTTYSIQEGNGEERQGNGNGKEKGKLIDRLSLLRQKSSGKGSSNGSSRMAFHTSSSFTMKGKTGMMGPMSRFVASTTNITVTTASGTNAGSTSAAEVEGGGNSAVGGATCGNGNGNGKGNGIGNGNRSTAATNGIVKVKGNKKNCSINWFNAAAANRRR